MASRAAVDALSPGLDAQEFDLIHAAVLRGFPELVRRLGGNPEPLLARHGLRVDACERGKSVTCRQWISVMEAAARALGRADFGLLLAGQQGGAGVYGPLGAVMRHARTFGDALRYVVAHNPAHSLAVRVWMGETASRDHVFVGHDLLVEGVPARAQAVEQILLSGHFGARYLTADKAGVRRVHFRHRALSPASVYRRHFGCEVRFCQTEDGVAFDAAVLEAPVVDADAEAFRHFADEIDRRFGRQRAPFHARVRGIVMQLLWTGQCRNDDVAAMLGLHPRTLLRRLREEATSFQRIKDEVRLDLMVYYLRHSDLALSRISEMLGFTEQSVMSRFARARAGASPSELRAGRRGTVPLAG
ncbi:MAG: AraC family transcriptional regulator ligand-binding domain-containing protein [Sphingomonadales bacterium]|nr:AraC family transcriptional regulator ligand-binding domain-containing protein [Sphingomonadales bacterium]